MERFIKYTQRALLVALDHDVLNTAKAVAYSGMLCFFPAVMVVTAILAQAPEGASLVGVMRNSLEQVLPPDSMTLLQNSISLHHLRSTQVVVSAAVLAVFAGLGAMLSFMDGMRRAYGLPRDNWGFWEKRVRALLLVPLVLIPLWLASLLIVFGHQIESWMILNADHELRYFVLLFWRMVRWTVAVLTSISVLAALYHFGTRRTEHWGRVLPGAIAATLLWFPETLAFGWYVTRIADYTRFYGSFAAGIATLVWLYSTSFIALVGAELNGVLYQARLERIQGGVRRHPSTQSSAADPVPSRQ